MPAAPNRNGKAESRVVKKETFSDGSELIELENGALLLRESKFSRTEVLAEQQAPYNKPAPAPRKKQH